MGGQPRKRERSTAAAKGGRQVLVLFDAMGRSKALRTIWELREGRRLKFRDLTAACEASPTVINARLTELRALGLVAHERPEGYFLTSRGQELLEHLAPLGKWSQGFIAVRSRHAPPKILPLP